MADETLIRINDLAYNYAPGAPALDGFSFSVKRGERVGLVGRNGAGKSTLFLCMAGILEGFSGKIEIKGLSASNPKDLKEIRRALGIVFQSADDQLFNPTVLDDVAFGPRNLGVDRAEAIERSRSALECVGVTEDLFDRPPQRLSGGQKRRAALAGIMVMDPDILLLDEPCSDLDPAGRRSLLDLLANISCTQIVASHDLEMIRELADRVIVLDSGKVVGQGPTDEILADETLMKAHGLEVPYSLTCCHEHPSNVAIRKGLRHTH
ncbi:energy-coupling factor ABC transporter ATP-binding protein [Candidatus Hydrogenedentota bacterium]